mmetsp:Transcript_41277/g.58068  ORF Transcript_41277/g.58068 Transcript_41277/m.58068 type:complete len:140 (+) Transcript_41277:1-420(+)
MSTRRKKKHLSCAKDISNTTRHIWLLHHCVPRAINHAKIKSIAYHSSASVVSSYALTFAVGGVLGLLGTAGVRMGVAVIKLIRLSVIGINDLGTVTTAATIASILVEKSDGAIDMQEQEENNSDNSFSKRPFCAWRSWS